VDQTGRLAPAALARRSGVLREYADVIAGFAAQSVRMVATSATATPVTRPSSSAGYLMCSCDRAGGPHRAGEAMLSFTGATAELAARSRRPLLVADIGGGSTELVLGPGADGGRAAPHQGVRGGGQPLPRGYGGAGSPP